MNNMKTLQAIAALAGTFVAGLPLTAGAAPRAKKLAPAFPVTYRAQCGMTYTAAEAKKDHYVCPMDGQKMTLVPQIKAARPPKLARDR